MFTTRSICNLKKLKYARKKHVLTTFGSFNGAISCTGYLASSVKKIVLDHNNGQINDVYTDWQKLKDGANNIIVQHQSKDQQFKDYTKFKSITILQNMYKKLDRMYLGPIDDISCEYHQDETSSTVTFKSTNNTLFVCSEQDDTTTIVVNSKYDNNVDYIILSSNEITNSIQNILEQNFYDNLSKVFEFLENFDNKNIMEILNKVDINSPYVSSTFNEGTCVIKTATHNVDVHVNPVNGSTVISIVSIQEKNHKIIPFSIPQAEKFLNTKICGMICCTIIIFCLAYYEQSFALLMAIFLFYICFF